jgi:hypothetical protein
MTTIEVDAAITRSLVAAMMTTTTGDPAVVAMTKMEDGCAVATTTIMSVARAVATMTTMRTDAHPAAVVGEADGPETRRGIPRRRVGGGKPGGLRRTTITEAVRTAATTMITECARVAGMMMTIAVAGAGVGSAIRAATPRQPEKGGRTLSMAKAAGMAISAAIPRQLEEGGRTRSMVKAAGSATLRAIPKPPEGAGRSGAVGRHAAGIPMMMIVGIPGLVEMTAEIW